MKILVCDFFYENIKDGFNEVMSYIIYLGFFNPLLTLIWGGWGGGVILSPYWFSLNNSETVKAVTLPFCSIQENFIRGIRAKCRISKLSQSPDIGQNSDGGISDFRISGQSLIKENCHNSRTNDDIDMKLGPVINLTIETKQRQKNVSMVSCQKIVTSLSFFQFMANLEQSGSRNLDA